MHTVHLVFCLRATGDCSVFPTNAISRAVHMRQICPALSEDQRWQRIYTSHRGTNHKQFKATPPRGTRHIGTCSTSVFLQSIAIPAFVEVSVVGYKRKATLYGYRCAWCCTTNLAHAVETTMARTLVSQRYFYLPATLLYLSYSIRSLSGSGWLTRACKAITPRKRDSSAKVNFSFPAKRENVVLR